MTNSGQQNNIRFFTIKIYLMKINLNTKKIKKGSKHIFHLFFLNNIFQLHEIFWQVLGYDLISPGTVHTFPCCTSHAILARSVSTFILVFFDVHNAFIKEKMCSVGTLVPGKQNMFCTSSKQLWTGIEVSSKCLKTCWSLLWI